MGSWRMLREEIRWWRTERRQVRGVRSSFWNLYDRILNRFHWARLPMRKKIVRVRMRGDHQPFFVRLGTSDYRVLKQLFVQNEYAPVVAQASGPVRTIVDLGANVGFSIRYWQEAFKEARILAVEPDPSNMALCRRNALAGQVAFAQCCVAGREKVVTLDRSQGEWAYRMVDANAPDAQAAPVLSKDAAASTMAARTMEAILADAGFEGEIDLLKCDIEGAEAELFSECAPWIHRVRQMVVEVHPPYSRQALLADLVRAGWPAAEPVVLASGVYEVIFLQRAAR